MLITPIKTLRKPTNIAKMTHQSSEIVRSLAEGREFIESISGAFSIAAKDELTRASSIF
jgi:hypothetical protein